MIIPFFSPFCCCSVFFNAAGWMARTTSLPSECFQRIYQRLRYYLSLSFPWLIRTCFVLLHKRMRKRMLLLCFWPLAGYGLKQAAETSQMTQCHPPSTMSSDTERSGVGDDGTAGKSIPAIAQLEWDRLPNCSRARMDLTDFLLYSRKRPNLPHGLIPTPERELPPAADFTVSGEKQRQRQAPRSKEATSPFCLINLVYIQWHFN